MRAPCAACRSCVCACACTCACACGTGTHGHGLVESRSTRACFPTALEVRVQHTAHGARTHATLTHAHARAHAPALANRSAMPTPDRGERSAPVTCCRGSHRRGARHGAQKGAVKVAERSASPRPGPWPRSPQPRPPRARAARTHGRGLVQSRSTRASLACGDTLHRACKGCAACGLRDALRA